MTLTIKNSPDLNSPGKPGSPSQNSENNPGTQSPRSNPLCLEVNVTLRNLPGEAGSPAQPIREEGKTVIVFENGAVLRITNNLPVGQTVILANPNGREVVCRAVNGRKLPSVKGYVEVEFVEPAKDFWGLQQNQNNMPVTTAPPTVTPPALREIPAPPLPSRAVAPSEETPKPANVSLGRGPSFEDIPGLLSAPASKVARETKTQPARPASASAAKSESDYNSENAQSTSVANWRQQDSELATGNRPSRASRESWPITSPTTAPTRDFMSKGLMAYEQSGSSSSPSKGRTPLILGVAALILAGVCGGVYFMRQGGIGGSVARTVAVSQQSAPVPPPAAKKAPEPVQSQQEESAPVATRSQANTQAQPDTVEQPQLVPANEPVPAVFSSTASKDSHTVSANVQKQGENATVTKQSNPTSSRRPAIPNLKMSSPTAPIRNAGSLGQGSAPVTEIASTEAVGSIPPAGLLTSTGKTFNPPVQPPSAPAPPPVPVAKKVLDPKLISSTRLVYPPGARQSHIEGIVTVSASIDERGKVVGAKAVSGPMVLRQAAVDSVSQWKYSPGSSDGKPVPSQVTVNLEFRLN
jgi:protein TonB